MIEAASTDPARQPRAAGGLRARALLLALALVAALALPWLLAPQGYLLRVACLILLFAALAQAWNIAAGLSGLTSLGHAGFFGAGAYVSTLLLVRLGVTPWLGLLAAAATGALLAALLCLPTLRLRGHYFALATLAFGEVMRVIANSWTSLTGGPVGISVPFSAPGLAAMQFQSLRPYYYLLLVALLFACAVFERIRRGALGLRLRALKNHPDAAASLGVDTARAKLIVAVISGALTAALGVLYAQFMFFFDPDTVFGLAGISVRAALIAIIGGVGTLAGPLIGALLIIPVEEGSNALFSAEAAGLSQLVFGAVLIAVVLWQPRGLLALLAPRRGGR
jgi:branched-chain amino acid transport system permease protein